MILGDFNIYVKDNDDDDDDGLQFSDRIEALGPTQWVNFPSHNKGNTLDLILTETVTDLIIRIIKNFTKVAKLFGKK